jgi:heme-degrading monooxygenase HmoA
MSMVVRATEAEIDVVRTDPADAVEVFRQSIIPALRRQDGYRGLYVLLSEEGKMLVLTLWESDEAARATRLSGFYERQIAKFEDVVFFRNQPGREAYDVVVEDAPQDAVVAVR